ncbi:MAG TPA: RNA polymerase sigma factor [Gemmatimonadales bacterium]|nr:RNA polymerase sigma factor [Gemmatimonadales bacterium]
MNLHREARNLTVPRDLAPATSDTADALLAASGDTTAFERLYRRHGPRIHALACRMLETDEADDAVQDIFIRVWDKLGTFRGEAAFSTWLHRLAVNVMLGRRSTLRWKWRRRHESEETVALLPAPTDRPGQALDFRGAVAQLPEGARQVFVLHDVEGYRHEEIAGMLGINTGTSKSQLHRARMALRKYLER